MSRVEEVAQSAALFLVRSEEPDWSAADQMALDGWLGESIAHVAAYWRLEHGWREADRIGALGPLIEERAERRRNRWRFWQMAVAASLALIVGFDAAAPLPEAVENVPKLRFDTPVGGHSVVPLADGSVVELNTATAVKAAVSMKHREFWLDRGEAFFQIAHLDGRPFVVHAGTRSITVLGTKFSVRRDADRIIVSVLEGRVAVADTSGQAGAPAAILTAGDVAVANGESTLLKPASAKEVNAGLAWRGGMLEFDNSPLADVAREFNRYNRVQIVISDPEAAQIRISGEFQASNANAFARLLREAYRVQVTWTPQVMAISS